jgi:hypothetical protein
VSRAFHYPPIDPYSIQEATDFLTAKLDDIILKSQNLITDYECVKYIFVVLAYDSQTAADLMTAWESINSATKANTIVLVVTTDGDDNFLYE